jgi:hypothetical protein
VEAEEEAPDSLGQEEAVAVVIGLILLFQSQQIFLIILR